MSQGDCILLDSLQRARLMGPSCSLQGMTASRPAAQASGSTMKGSLQGREGRYLQQWGNSSRQMQGRQCSAGGQALLITATCPNTQCFQSKHKVVGSCQELAAVLSPILQAAICTIMASSMAPGWLALACPNTAAVSDADSVLQSLQEPHSAPWQPDLRSKVLMACLLEPWPPLLPPVMAFR